MEAPSAHERSPKNVVTRVGGAFASSIPKPTPKATFFATASASERPERRLILLADCLDAEPLPDAGSGNPRAQDPSAQAVLGPGARYVRDGWGSGPDVWEASGMQHSSFGLPLGPGFLDLARGMREPWPRPLMKDLAGVKLNGNTACALALWCDEKQFDCDVVHIYLDGSGGSGEFGAAWAFVCFQVREMCCCDRPFHFLGFACGPVECDPSQAGFLGVDSADSNAAELSARIWACMWALQAGYAKVVFIYDSCFAAGVTKALTKSRVHCDAAKLSAAIWHVLVTVCDAWDFHVHSHQGQPWNELADSIATLASRGFEHNPCDGRMQGLMGELVSLQWAFLAHLPRAARQQYPECAGIVGAPGLALAPGAIAARIDGCHLRPPEASRAEPEELLVCTYNVLSLKAKDKRTQLAEALGTRRCHIAGLQEGRSRKAGVWCDDGYLRVVAPSAGGNYGCQIWISVSLPFARHHGRPVRIGRDNITVEHCEPRRLVVVVQAPGVHIMCLSLHAPHGMEANEAKLWWSETSDIVTRCARVADKLVFVDANAAVPLGVEGVTGEHAAGSKVAPRSGAMLAEFALEHGLLVPCTFDEYVGKGPQCTYTPIGADGPTCRSDYVLIGRAFSVKRGSAAVWHDVDLGHRRDDHYPAVLTVQPPPKMPHVPTKRRKPCYDRTAVGEPYRDEIFRREVESFPAIPFSVEPTTHCHLVTEWMRAALVKAYGAPSAPTKKPYISEATREMIFEKNCAARDLRRAGTVLGNAPAYVAFKIWAGHWVHLRYSAVSGFATLHQCGAMVRLKRRHCALKERVNSVVHLEHLAYVDAAADRADAALASGNPVAVYAAVKDFLPKGSRSTVRVKMSDGKPAPSYVDERGRFRDHFAGLLGGAVVPFRDLVARERDDHTPSELCVKIGGASINSVPSMSALVCELAHSKSRKAVGEDGIGGEVFKVAPWSLARVWHPLFVKSALTLRPPLQFRGGMITELLKVNASGGECDHYRDITIADHTAKTFCKIFRPEIVSAAAAVVPTGQFGAGFNGGSTDVAHLALSAFLDAASAARQSAAILFVDLATAFASLLRRLCVPADAGDEQWLAALAAAGFSQDEVKRIYDEASSYAYWGRAGLSEHTLQIAAALHRMTWFTTEGLPHVVGTSRGSQAGMSLADVMFIAAAGRVADEVAEGLTVAGVTARLPHDAAACLFGNGCDSACSDAPHIYYVDDGALPIVAAARDLAVHIGRAACVVADVYFKFGFELRAGPNKTAVLVQWRGDGAITEQRKMQSGTNVGLRCQPARAPPFDLPVVHVYKHLGTRTAVGSSMGPEVAFKEALVTEDLRRLRRRVLANPAVPLRDRARIAQVAVLSRLLFQIGSWPKLTGSLARRFHSAVMRVYRAAAGVNYESGLTDAAVIEQLEAIPPLVVLRLARVTLAVRVASLAPAAVQALLCQARPCPRSWLRALEEDLVWFAGLGVDDQKLRAQALPLWWAAFRREPFAYRRAFLVAARSGAARRTQVWATSAAERELVEQHPCGQCGKTFATRQAFAVHDFRAHGTSTAVRWHVSTTFCPVCLLEFHTRDRVIAHFRMSSVCRMNLLLNHPRLSVEEFEALQTRAAEKVRALRASGRARCYAAMPCYRLQGPLPLAVAPTTFPGGHPLGHGRRWHS